MQNIDLSGLVVTVAIFLIGIILCKKALAPERETIYICVIGRPSRLIRQMYDRMMAEDLKVSPGDLGPACIRDKIFENREVTITYRRYNPATEDPLDGLRFISRDGRELIINFNNNEIVAWCEDKEAFDLRRAPQEVLYARTLMNNVRRMLRQSSA